MKAFISIIVLAALSGCSHVGKLEKWDSLGIVEAEITGKFSHTTYRTSVEGGVQTSIMEHNNPWVPKVYIRRERRTGIAD
jgi:uncharacterized protein YceK